MNLTQARLGRLLLDAMQYLSAQGLAAYPGDVTRETRYRLDHVYGKRQSAVKDPGAGGATDVPDAAGPSGVAETVSESAPEGSGSGAPGPKHLQAIPRHPAGGEGAPGRGDGPPRRG